MHNCCLAAATPFARHPNHQLADRPSVLTGRVSYIRNRDQRHAPKRNGHRGIVHHIPCGIRAFQESVSGGSAPWCKPLSRLPSLNKIPDDCRRLAVCIGLRSTICIHVHHFELPANSCYWGPHVMTKQLPFTARPRTSFGVVERGRWARSGFRGHGGCRVGLAS